MEQYFLTAIFFISRYCQNFLIYIFNSSKRAMNRNLLRYYYIKEQKTYMATCSTCEKKKELSE
jgi:hypothetical protein